MILPALRNSKQRFLLPYDEDRGFTILNPTEILMLTSDIDPRFCKLKFLDDELKGDARLEITRLMKELMESADSVHVAPVQSPCKQKTKTALDILLGEEGDDDPYDDCEDEVSQYFAEKVVPRNNNPLQWWKMNELRFKHLSRVASSILCVPAT